MDNFLDSLSIYNAKAAVAISTAVAESNNGKANMMSSLKTTANDLTLSEEVRLNALTALINLGNLLDIPLPPYFPSVTTYALTETFVGVHNDLDGIQGGAPGEYYHLTDAERTSILNKASVGDITWANLGGVYSQNVLFAPVFDAKQNALSAPAAGTYFVKVTGNTVSYDSNSYISNINSIAAGGELEGFYPDPTLSNAAVIGKLLTGFDPLASIGAITPSDTILSAIEKLNANIDSVIANPSGVASVAFTNNAALVFTTTASPSTGAASLSLSLNSQTANLVLASPNATTGQPSFRSLVAADLPNSGVTAATYGSSTVIPQIQVDAKGRITGVTSITAASGGQVNTITLAIPSFLSPSNINNAFPASPEIVLQLATQAANTVFAGPISGASVVPAFRSLVEDDIPQLSTSKITNLTNILDGFLTDNLSDGSIWIGNTSNAAVQRVLSGDVTVSNTGVTAIGLAKVQYNMIQDVTTQTLLGRYDALDGEVQQITLSGVDFVLNSGTGVLSLASPVAPVVSTKGDLLGHDLTVQQRVPSNNIDGSILLVNNSATGVYTDLGLNWVAMSGDATITAAGALTIASNAVTLGKIAQIANNTVLGNVSGALGNVSALSTTQLTTLVNQFSIDTSGGNTGLKGVVPGFNINVLPAGKTAADYFLNASGAWSLGGGGSGSGTVSSGSQYQLAYYAANGTTVSGLTLITASRALVSDANGLPTASATTATELGYVSGVSSPIQTQINGKEPTISILSIAKGGTNGNATPTAGGVSYGTSTAYAFTAAGTTGQIFRSNGAAAPTWSTATYPATTTINKILYSSSDNVVGEINAPTSADTFLKWTGSVFTWAGAGSGSGTVTSGGPDQLAYYLLSGTTVQGLTTGTGVLTALGVAVGTAGAFITNGGALGTPASGTLTNCTFPTLNQNTTGSAASLTTGRNIRTDLSSTTAASFNGTADINPGVTGTLGVASGGTGAVTLTGLLRGTGTTAITGSATVALGSEVGGTLLPANGGTGITTNTAYAVVLGGTTNGGVLTQVASLGSSGQVLTSNGAGAAPTFQTGGGSVALNNVLASTGSSAGGGILNTTSTITWNWNSNTTTNAFVLNSTNITTGALLSVTHSNSAFTGTSGIVSFTSAAVTSGTILSVAHSVSSLSGNVASFTSSTISTGNILNLAITGTTASTADNLVITNSSTANTSGRGIDVSITGATVSGNTFGAFISNTKTGATSVNTALSLTTSGATTNYGGQISVSGASTTNYGLLISSLGGTTNYAIDVTAGIVRLAASTASLPHMIFSPGAAALTASTNGMLSYATVSSNSSFYLYKDSAVTTILTKDRNPEFATGAQGVVVADASGNFTKSADLTALGVLATYSTYTVTTSATNIFSTVSLTGSTGLPANFFAVGKTIVVVVSGQYTSTSGSPTLPLTLAFGTYSQAFIVNLHSAIGTASLWEAKIIITCSASGASGALRTMAQAVALDDTTNGTPKFSKLLIQTASSFNTTSASTISLNASYVSPATTATIDMCQITYLN